MNTSLLRTASALMLLATATAATATPIGTLSSEQAQAASAWRYWRCPVVDRQGNVILDLIPAARTREEAIAAVTYEAELVGGTLVDCYPAGG